MTLPLLPLALLRVATCRHQQLARHAFSAWQSAARLHALQRVLECQYRRCLLAVVCSRWRAHICVEAEAQRQALATARRYMLRRGVSRWRATVALKAAAAQVAARIDRRRQRDSFHHWLASVRTAAFLRSATPVAVEQYRCNLIRRGFVGLVQRVATSRADTARAVLVHGLHARWLLRQLQLAVCTWHRAARAPHVRWPDADTVRACFSGWQRRRTRAVFRAWRKAQRLQRQQAVFDRLARKPPAGGTASALTVRSPPAKATISVMARAAVTDARPSTAVVVRVKR